MWELYEILHRYGLYYDNKMSPQIEGPALITSESNSKSICRTCLLRRYKQMSSISQLSSISQFEPDINISWEFYF